MPVEIVTKGFIEVWRGDVFVSRHTVETKAIESALEHSETAGDGDYELRFPTKVMGRITKRLSPITWSGAITTAWTQDTSAQLDLAAYLRNPERKAVVYAVVGTLPSGVTLTGATLAYDGAGVAATAPVTFTASAGGFTVSTAGTVTVSATAANQPPHWEVGDGYVIQATPGQVINFAQYAHDPEGDPMAFTLSSWTLPGASLSADGLMTVPANTTTDSYSVRIGIDSAGAAEADWVARSQASGVVWAHDFSSDAEVNQFRWTGGYGNDPASVHPNSANCRRITSDAQFPSGCLEINIPTGGAAGSNWWRPFSAIVTPDNGRANSDAAFGGVLVRRSWDATAAQYTQYRNYAGYYGPATAQASFPYWPHPSQSSDAGSYVTRTDNIWDGDEFWLQLRVKLTAGRFADAGNPSGKFLFISNTAVSNGAQELVLTSRNDGWANVYTNNGGSAWGNSYLTNPQGDANTAPGTAQYQPGSAWGPTCTRDAVNASGPVGSCFCFAPDTWYTLLFHMKPGRQGNPFTYPSYTDAISPYDVNANPYRETILQVYVAAQGATSYTTLWDKSDYVWAYGTNGNYHPPGLNAVILSAFMNGDGTGGVNASTGWQQRYAQVILSKSFIPCPTI